MLQRSKSNRSQRSRKHTKAAIAHRLAAREDGSNTVRCSDGDTPQSSMATAAPVFASVHRPRHAGMSAIRRDGITAKTSKTLTTTTAQVHHQQQQQQQQQQLQYPQRPSYQQYQQQRRQQQQLIQKQEQQKLFENMPKVAKSDNNKSNWQLEKQQQNCQQQPKTVPLSGLPQPYDIVPTRLSRIPIQQQQQQQQQLQQQQNFYQISKTATNLLNDIYEKHLLSHTTFHNGDQQHHQHHQQQQQQQLQQQQQYHQQQQYRFIGRSMQKQYVDSMDGSSSVAGGGDGTQCHNDAHHEQQQQQLKSKQPLHFLKLPPPPPPPQVTQQPTATATGITTFPYQQHFQFTDAYVEPVNNKQHFLLESTPLPNSGHGHTHASVPPSAAPQNHVYETIKERPPMPPPKLYQTALGGAAPPLPPSRQLKKQLMAAAAGLDKGSGSGRPALKRKEAHPVKQSEHSKRQQRQQQHPNGKMLPATQPPAYVAPPATQLQLPLQQQQQYNPQQRTKADGEQQQASCIYQQRHEYHQQQQQQPPLENSKENYQQQHQQQQQQQEKKQVNMREHPLGAAIIHSVGPTTIEAGQVPITTTPMAATLSSTCSKSNNKNTNTNTTSVSDTATTAAGKGRAPQLSVEQTLQNAGLLQPVLNSSSSSALLSVALGGCAVAGDVAAYNNNQNNNHNRPTALPIVFEEDTGEFQDVLVLEDAAAGTAKLQYRHGKIEVRLETAQAMAAAAYYARAAQKFAQQSGSAKSRSNASTSSSYGGNGEMPPSTSASRNGGFCGALQRAPPPMPPGLSRRLANKESYGIGKVKVMLRVSDTHTDTENAHFMAVDKKKRQVTLTDPTAANSMAASTSQERGPMVAAPKMFAFDSLFTAEDQQSDVCASALSEVIPAVLEGSDGCLLTIGYPSSGQSKTILGGVNPPSELGAIACAISWLYKGINERRQKSGARFSVRVSALGVSATKPDSSSKDLLAAHATESDDSPGVYLRDDFLGGPTELRAPTAERAALFLDAALAGRPQGGLEPAMIFTLHVYQYSLSRKGGVAGGRSRLHLIDLGGCANRNGGLPLSGIGNILLAILSGQRHPPNKDHPLTPLLKDCLAPLTCHVAIMAHVTHTQSHTDALTTIQLASRIHRMRRRKHRFPMPSDKTGAVLAAAGLNGGHQSTGSSAGSGADPSSSELSADTVIYMGPSDDATDGEHPPVYLPSLNSGDNRGVMSKVLKGSGLQQPQSKNLGTSKKAACTQKAPQSPITASRTGSLKRGAAAHSPTPQQQLAQQLPAASDQQQQQFYSPVHSLSNMPHSASSPKIVAGGLRHPNMAVMCSKGSNVPSPKGSPLRRPGVGGMTTNEPADCTPGSPMRKITEEQWIDGPRVSRAKVAEARHLMREVNHVKQCETWIDGPKSQSSRSLTAGNLPPTASQVQGYGFMDSHKKTMIRQWVENQTSQVFQATSAASSPTHHTHRDQQAQHLRNITYHMSQLKQKSLDATEEMYATSTRQQQHPAQTEQQLQQQPSADQHSLRSSQLELVHPIGVGLSTAISTTNASAPAEIRGATQYRQMSTQSQPADFNQRRDETDLDSTHSLHSHAGRYGSTAVVHYQHQQANTSASETGQHTDNWRQAADCEEDQDQDSGPSEVPPALPLIEPLGSREISHESLHRIISRHVSRESLFHQQHQQEMRRHEELTHNSPRQSSHHYSQHSMGMSDCGLQVTEEEIARTMSSEHPLAALSHCENMSIVSSFNMAGDAFSDCAMGERTRNQFDQLARLRQIFTSQLAMAEVTPVFRTGCDVSSVYSEPAYRFNTGPGSVCSEPPYRPPSPRQPSRSPSQGSLPSLNGIMQIAGMEQYASLRHPDGASDPNLPKIEKAFVLEHENICEVDEKSTLLTPSKRPSLEQDCNAADDVLNHLASTLPITAQTQLPLLPLNTSSEAYDSGHDSSTPRTSKHSGISRRAESGYHSVATARDSDESSFTSGLSKEHHNRITIVAKKKRQEKGLCTWLMNPFTCTYPETEGEISDF